MWPIHSSSEKVHDWVREYSAEHLSVDPGTLFCNARRTAVSSKASSLKRHMATARHTAGKEQQVWKAERQQTLAQFVADYSKTVNPSGETLSEKERVFRVGRGNIPPSWYSLS